MIPSQGPDLQAMVGGLIRGDMVAERAKRPSEEGFDSVQGDMIVSRFSVLGFDVRLIWPGCVVCWRVRRCRWGFPGRDIVSERLIGPV